LSSDRHLNYFLAKARTAAGLIEFYEEVEMDKRYALVLALIVFVPSISSTVLGAERTVTVTDEAGRAVEVPHPPERIVCLVPAAAEVIYALDESHRMVGRTDDCDMPPALLEKPSVGTASNRVNVELILDLNPDLVIGRTGALFPEEIEEQIEINGVPVLRYRALQLSTLFPMIADLGLILKKEDEAEELGDYVEDYYETIRERVKPLAEEDKPRVYFMSMGHIDWTGGADSAGSERITEAGGVNVAEDLPGSLAYVSREWILEEDPDVILYSRVSSSGDIPTVEDYEKTVEEKILSEPGFSDLASVRTGRIYLFDISMASGFTEIVTYLQFAQWFHPQLFADVDPEAVHREIFEKYFDMELEGTWAYQRQMI
jgi:iron complex transport system substrate-binding protein